MAAGSEPVVIVRSEGLITSVYVRDAVRPLVSLTFAVTENVPACVGVPARVFAEAAKPAGAPLIDQLSGGTPPVAVIVTEYAIPTVPVGSEAVVICNAGGAMITVKLPEAVPAAESLTVTVTLKVPACVGVPPRAEPVSVTPGG